MLYSMHAEGEYIAIADSMPFLTHPSGVKTFFHDDDFTDPWKKSETILIQHGFGRSSAFWYEWIPVLASKYRVIRRDALGHGYSSGAPPGHPKTVQSVLEEIIDTLDQLKIQKVHYLGESTGGIWGHFLGALHPDRLLSVTTCASPLVLSPEIQKALSFGYPDPMASLRALGARGWGEAFVAYSDTDEGAPDGYMQWWLDQFAIPSSQNLIDHAEIICKREFDAHLVMDKIKVPLLLLVPAHSQLVDIEEQRKLASMVDVSEMKMIPGHGHEIYLDQAEMCQQTFMAFLDRIRR